MSERLDFLIPGDLDAATGGYIYDRRIIHGLRELGWSVYVHRLGASFPTPTGDALQQAGEILAQIPSGRLTVIDGLAMGVIPDLVARESRRLRLVGLVHHPLAEETGLVKDRAAFLRNSEQQALAAAQKVVVTSRYTASLVAGLGVPMSRIEVVEPGTDPAPLARGSGCSTLNLLCVGALIHRKGHSVLIHALARLADLDWRLNCVGSLDRSPSTVVELRDQIRRLGLEGRVSLAGEVDLSKLADLYDQADLFVLATRFEGYGMALAEALAHGLPVVSTKVGAVPGTVPDAAGLLVPPGDVESLATALAQVIRDSGLRKRLAEGARAARARLAVWPSACLRMDRVLREIPT